VIECGEIQKRTGKLATLAYKNQLRTGLKAAQQCDNRSPETR